MLSHILQNIRKQLERSNNLHNQYASEALHEINQAHIFESHIPAGPSSDQSSYKGVTQNSRNAMWNYLRAALRGDKEAQYKMGLSYLNGQLGLDRNYHHAEKWLSQAAHQGHQQAKDDLQKALNELAIS